MQVGIVAHQQLISIYPTLKQLTQSELIEVIGLDFPSGVKKNRLLDLPADPETLVYYITTLGKTLKASPIKQKMVEISQHDVFKTHEKIFNKWLF